MRWLDLSDIRARMLIVEDIFGAPHLTVHVARPVQGTKALLGNAGFRRLPHGDYALLLPDRGGATVAAALGRLSSGSAPNAGRLVREMTSSLADIHPALHRRISEGVASPDDHDYARTLAEALAPETINEPSLGDIGFNGPADPQGLDVLLEAPPALGRAGSPGAGLELPGGIPEGVDTNDAQVSRGADGSLELGAASGDIAAAGLDTGDDGGESSALGGPIGVRGSVDTAAPAELPAGTPPDEPQSEGQAEPSEPAAVADRQRARLKALQDRRAHFAEHRPTAAAADARQPLTAVERDIHDPAVLARLAELAVTPIAHAEEGIDRAIVEACVKYTASLSSGALTSEQIRAAEPFARTFYQLAQRWEASATDTPSAEELASYGEQPKTSFGLDETRALLFRHEAMTTSVVTDDFARLLWEAAGQAGFQTGHVLLPNSGMGSLARLRPDERDIRVTQVPNEPMAAAICQRIYPEDAVIDADWGRAVLPGAFYDLAIAVSSSTPSVDAALQRPLFVQDEALHLDADLPPLLPTEHLIYKTLVSLRAGGVAVVVIPTGHLSAANDRDRMAVEAICRYGEVLATHPVSSRIVHGASSATVDSARGNSDLITHGAESMSVIALRKRPERLADAEATTAAADLVERLVRAPALRSMPSVRLATARMDAAGVIGIYDSEYFNQAYAAAVAQIRDEVLPLVPPGALLPRARIHAVTTAPVANGPAGPARARGLEDGTYVVTADGATVAFRQGGAMRALDHLPGDEHARLRGLIGIRMQLVQCLDHQLVSSDDEVLAQIQGELKTQHDAFTARFGALSLPVNRNAFEADIYATSLMQLETYDEVTETYARSPFFTERVIRRPMATLRADSVDEALSLSLGERGVVDPALIATLMQRPWDEVRAELGEKVFLDPMLGHWTTASMYLSGPVRAKLITASRAEEIAPEVFGGNAHALAAVQPAEVESTNIKATIGAPWVPVHDYERFIRDCLGIPTAHSRAVSVVYTPTEGRFSVSVDLKNADPARVQDFTSGDIEPAELFRQTLNGRAIRATMPHPDGKLKGGKAVLVTDHAATAQAHIYQERLRDDFIAWCGANPHRSARLARIYNEKVNCFRRREVTGDYLRFDLCSPRWTPFSQQRAAVARFIEEGSLIALHGPGNGKTFTLAACAIEAARMGLFSKPILTTPVNTFPQTAAEIIKAYPTARILLGERLSDRNPEGVSEFVAKAALHQWDLILLTYESFKAVKLSPQALIQGLRRERLFLSHEAVRDSNGRYEPGRRERMLSKRIESLQAAAQPSGGLRHFDDIGCDLLLVDEIHNFKNVDLSSKLNVLGINKSGNLKTRDLEAKISHIRSFNGSERGVVTATATLICNTVAEMYTMMNFVRPSIFRSMGIRHFDAWAATFGRVQALIEQKPAGDGFQIRERFSRFQNVPELMRALHMCADVRLDDSKVDASMVRPTMRTHLVAAPRGPVDDAICKSMEIRARHLEANDPLWKHDSVIVIMGDLRRSMLDPRLLDPTFPVQGTEIVGEVVARVKEGYDRTQAELGTQFVFCDQGVRGKSFVLYEDIRDRLIASGIPGKEIALITDHALSHQRKKLVDRFNRGLVRVLIGSTKQIGVGLNGQRRAAAMHQVDIPYRPDELLQRLGRAVRPGNCYASVDNYVYGKQGQTRSFEIVYNKAKAINQAFQDPDRAARTISEEMDASLENIQMDLTDNDLLRDKVTIDQRHKQLGLLRTAHVRTAASMRVAADESAADLADLVALERSPRLASAVDLAKAAHTAITQRKAQRDLDLVAAREAVARADDGASEAAAALRRVRDQIAARLGAAPTAPDAAELPPPPAAVTHLRPDLADVLKVDANAAALSEPEEAELDAAIARFAQARGELERRRDARNELEKRSPGVEFARADVIGRTLSQLGELIYDNTTYWARNRDQVICSVDGLEVLSAPDSLTYTTGQTSEARALGIMPDADVVKVAVAQLRIGDIHLPMAVGSNMVQNGLRVYRTLAAFIEATQSLTARVEALTARVADLRARAEAPFEHEDELADLSKRKAEVDAALLMQRGDHSPEEDARVLAPLLGHVLATGRPLHPAELAQWSGGDNVLDEAPPEEGDEAQLVQRGNEAMDELLGDLDPHGDDFPPHMAIGEGGR